VRLFSYNDIKFCGDAALERQERQMSHIFVPLIIFGFVFAVIFGPRYLRFKERERVLEMVRLAMERGQAVPPELLDALKFDAYRSGGRRGWGDDYAPYSSRNYGPANGWERGAGAAPQPAPPPPPQPTPAPAGDPGAGAAPSGGPAPQPTYGPTPGWTGSATWDREENRRAMQAMRYGPDRDLRRGVILLGVGLGFVAIGLAFYAGLYYVGGASETFATFAAIGAIPGFIGLAHIVLWSFTRKTTRL
jgi:hypothetical protein